MNHKPKFSLYLLYYAEACNEFMVPTSATYGQGSTATCVDVEAMV